MLQLHTLFLTHCNVLRPENECVVEILGCWDKYNNCFGVETCLLSKVIAVYIILQHVL